MAKKRRRAQHVPKRVRRRNTPPKHQSPIGDPRAMEGEMAKLVGQISGEEAAPLDMAQEMIYEAFDSSDPQMRVALAQAALEISPDCADAYVLLAEHCRTPAEAVEHYRRGVAAARRALGERTFREDVGHFWGLLQTRPYMRARAGLADCLRALCRHDEAVDHYQDMLRLNPGDNQGIRYRLGACLLELGRDDALKQLLDAYADDASAEFAYARALAAFRAEGDTSGSRGLLESARQTNAHVPVYLLGDKPLPARLPDYVHLGGESEAVGLVASYQGGWKSSPGALTWLRSVVRIVPPGGSQRRSSLAADLAAVAALPQVSGEVWQVDAVRVGALIASPDASLPNWILVAVYATEERPLAIEPTGTRPSAAAVWNVLFECIRAPESGEAHRPEIIQVCKKTYQRQWRRKLEVLGIGSEYCERLEPLDELLTDLVERVSVADSPMDDDADAAELPQYTEEVWQADVRRAPVWLQDEGEVHRPWSVMVTDRTHDLVLAQKLFREPADDVLCQYVLHAMHRPAAGPPRRPGVLEIRSADDCTALRGRLRPLGVECVVREQLDQWEQVFESLVGHLTRDDPVAPLIDSPELPLDAIGEYFAAAADFYRDRPWRRLRGDMPIRVEFPQSGREPWYAVVMGQSGMTLGLAVYEDLDGLLAILSGAGSPDQNARHTTGMSVTYGEPFEMPVRDLDAAERFGWPIAGPEAHPELLRLQHGKPAGLPSAEELTLLTATLRAISQFAEGEGDPLRVSIPVARGDCEVVVSWYAEG